MIRLIRNIIVFTIVFTIHSDIYGQAIDYFTLEQEIYKLNNLQKFDESQKKLHNLLGSNDITNTDKYYIYLFLSYTQKRIHNYDEVLRSLDSAYTAGAKTKNNVVFRKTIQVQRSFAYFDTGQYEKVEEVLDSLTKSGYSGISSDDLFKVFIQEGYLNYLKGKYTLANAKFDKAINLIKSVSICDLPLVYAKKMELYAELNDTINRNKYFKLSMKSVDSCGMVKYKLFVLNTAVGIYKRKKDFRKAYFYKAKSDSISEKYYGKEKYLSMLDDQKKEIFNKTDQPGNYKLRNNFIFLLVAMVICSLILAIYMKKRNFFARTSKEKSALNLGYYNLTRKEKEVLDLLEKEYSYKRICDELHISQNTLKFHVKNINKKRSNSSK